MRATLSRRPSTWLPFAAMLVGLAGILAAMPHLAAAGDAQSVASERVQGPVARVSGWVVGSDSADGYGVILHTADGGQSWVRQGSTDEIPDVGFNNVKAVDRDTAWAVGNADSGYGLVLRTSDAGLAWVRQGAPGMIPDGAIYGVGPVDKETAWIVGEAGSILRTEDGGQTWLTQESGTSASLYEVAAVDERTAWIVGDDDGGYAVVLHTDDAGRTWERQGTAATLGARGFIDLTVVDARTAWAVGGQGYIVKTTDGGASWRPQMGPKLSDNNGASAVDADRAWVVADYNTIYRTADGGATWDRRSPSLPADFYLLGVSAPGPDAAWIVGGAVFPSTGGVILSTADAGATWQTQSTPVDVMFRRIALVGPPPKTAVSGVPRGWVRRAVTMDLIATPASDGAPVAYTEYRVTGGAWTRGTRLTIRRQGVTRIAYRSADTRGTVEVTRTCTVRIDGVPPKVRGIGSPVAWHGGVARFVYRLTDPAVRSLRARLLITRYGRRVASVDLGMRPTGRRLVTSLPCTWPTSRYRWRVIVVDRTGQRAVGSAHVLRVLPRYAHR